MPIERKLAAIMFTDIAGYTALSAKDSTKASELLKTQRDILKPIVEKHGGSWMKEIGDGLLLTFDSATSAVECSIAIQEATKDIDDLNLRIGIHQGEVIKQDGDVIGDDVNVTSRIEPFSAIGGVAISDKIYRDISSNQEFETKYIGKPKLKGVAQKVEVYCITSHGLPETDVSKVSAKLEEKSKFNIFALTGGILTAIGIAFWIAVGVFDVSFGGKSEVPSVGILLMENLGERDEEFWSSGMTADLITRVSGAGLIRVAPLDDILKLDKDLSIEEKAKKLRVKYILTHSFLIKDNSFDLWCKLENIENGVALFSNKISEPMDMTTQMVGKLANDIVTSLKVKTKQDMMKAPTANAEAYEYYLRAKYIHIERKNIQDTKIIRSLLRKSIELDDKLLKAKVNLGWTYANTGEYEQAKHIFEDALKQSEKLNYELENADLLRALGNLYNNIGEYNKSLDYFNKAMVVQSNLGDNTKNAWLKNAIGLLYLSLGNYDKSLELIQFTHNYFIELGDSNSMDLNFNLAEVYFKMGQYQKAYEKYTIALKIRKKKGQLSHIFYPTMGLGKIYVQRHEYSTALKYLQEAYDLCKELDLRGWGEYIEVSTLLALTKKELGLSYNDIDFAELLNNPYKGIFTIDYNYRLYQVFDNFTYLETAYNQVQELANNLEPDVKLKFLSYPIPSAIVEEWEKVK